jgi:anthranilate synthase component 1
MLQLTYFASYVDPFKVIKTGEGYDIQGDPLKPLEAELSHYRYQSIPEVPTFTGKL